MKARPGLMQQRSVLDWDKHIVKYGYRRNDRIPGKRSNIKRKR